MSTDIIYGATSPLFLPARRWAWKHIGGPFTIDVNLCNTVEFKEGESKVKDIASFDCADDIDLWLNLGSLTKALFFESSYPDLNDNQVFTISSILVNKQENKVTVVGNILERVV